VRLLAKQVGKLGLLFIQLLKRARRILLLELAAVLLWKQLLVHLDATLTRTHSGNDMRQLSFSRTSVFIYSRCCGASPCQHSVAHRQLCAHSSNGQNHAVIRRRNAQAGTRHCVDDQQRHCVGSCQWLLSCVALGCATHGQT
jgi:hypothetical protein